MTLYHTEENTRHSESEADFFIGSDLSVPEDNYFRMPNWWCSVDWSNHGLCHKPSPRIKNLIDPDKLLNPLGRETLHRPKKAAIFTSHMREPRTTIINHLSSIIQVDGYGSAFNSATKNHNISGFFKEDILQNYMFCLCPENSMYPGYYTEKIPESFAAGCIPIGWSDQNVLVDFSRGAFINLADFARRGYASGLSEMLAPSVLEELTDTPLLNSLPDIGSLLDFIARVVREALS